MGVVGLGYVGLPFAVEAAKEGFKVIGIDLDPEKAASVNRGDNYIGDVKDEDLKDVVGKGLLEAVSDYDRVPEMDAIIIAVPTPLDKNLVPDMSYVRSVSESLSSRVRPGQLISLESTTYPGTTEEVIQPAIEKGSGLKVEQDFFLALLVPDLPAGVPGVEQDRSHCSLGPSDADSVPVAGRVMPGG